MERMPGFCDKMKYPFILNFFQQISYKKNVPQFNRGHAGPTHSITLSRERSKWLLNTILEILAKATKQEKDLKSIQSRNKSMKCLPTHCTQPILVPVLVWNFLAWEAATDTLFTIA